MTTTAQREMLSLRHETEFDSLRELSARVGSDPLLVQASNGNTSIKVDGNLWIKASGKCLANATREEMFVAIGLTGERTSIQKESEIVQSHGLNKELRPSIETPMHAVLPHRVVIHVHSINAIAWAIRFEGANQLQERLAGLRWQWIPYAASGIPLAREIEKAVARLPATDVFILGSHGLVVCGHDCDSAEERLRSVEQRLAITPRTFPKPDVAALNVIARLPRWQFPDVDLVHALGTDATCRKILKAGILYPCQAIFLGETIPVAPSARIDAKSPKFSNGRGSNPPFLAVERAGVLLNERMTAAEGATLLALARVMLRTPGSMRLRYLSQMEVADVLRQGAHGGKTAVAMEMKSNSPAGGEKSDRERKILYDRNTCAPWLGSQSRKLRVRTGPARVSPAS